MPHMKTSYAPCDLHLQTHNVRGLNIPEKRSRLLRDLRASRASVAFLQETHFRSGSAPTLRDAFYPVGFFSNYSQSKSRGVAILFSKDIPFVLDTTMIDEGGRYIFVRGSILDTVYTFVSIYLPNKKQHTCLSRILRTLETFQQGITILAGDFNVTLDPLVDSSAGTSTTPSHVLRTIRRALHDNRLVDVWRALHPMDRDYTYYSQVHCSYSRIDYFFMHHGNLNLSSSVEILATTWSDHAPIKLALQSPLFFPRERQWRLNVSMLDDPLISEELHTTLEQFFMENSTSDTPISALWEAHKAVIRGFFISKGTARKKLHTLERNTLLETIRVLELEHITSNDVTVYQRLVQARRALDKLASASLRFQAMKSRSFFALQENKPGRLLARILRDRRIKSYIPKIRSPEGTLVTDPSAISGEFLRFFSGLYKLDTPTPADRTLECIDAFLARTVLKPLDSTDREAMNMEITAEEILEALKTSKNGKCPGPDGLPIEYYKKNTRDLLPTLVQLFSAFREGVRPHPHSLMATISLIPKPEKDHTACGNYRPISLLNNDMKLLARVLANRLKRYMPQLINPDQVGFIPGREARDATIRIINTIAHSKRMARPLLLLSTDAEKAFDRVLWPYLFQTLKRYGVGEAFLCWITALYSTPTARVRVNGALTAAFQIHNGTRQGCPLSPLLFALSLEPLLSSIRQNVGIKGIQGAHAEHKVSAYADDLMFILPDPVGSMPEVVKELHEYGLLSGFKINVSKSEILAITPQKHWRRVLSAQYAFRWCSSSLVYLGIRLSPDIAKLFTLNFTPLFEVFKTDIARWTPKHLSWMGRISVIKMNLLPRLLYLFHTIPICIPLSFHKEIRTLFSSFIWPNTRPRLKHGVLCKSKRTGGLALPDTNLYYHATHLARVIDWVTGSPEQKWLDLEEAQAGRPMWTLPWLPWSAIKNNVKELSPVGSTLTVWHKARTKYTLSTYPSPLLPLRYNPDFPVEILQSLATRFTDSPNIGVHHIIRNGTFVTLEAPDRPAPTFAERFNFHQIKSFLRNLPNNNSLTRSLSPFENLCRRTSPLANGVSTLYGLLRDLITEPPEYMSRWERTLNTSITNEVWSGTLSLTHSGTQVTKLQETSYKLLTFWYRTPALMATFNITISPTCWRCTTAMGTYLHIWWECALIQIYWRRIQDLVRNTTDVDLDFTPQIFLLSQLPFSLKSMKKSVLMRILLVARSLIPLYWKSTSIPPLKTLIDRMETLRSNEELALSPTKAAQLYTETWYHWSTYCSSAQFRQALEEGNGGRGDPTMTEH
uniref:Reverse transcriptase domain-containing protein n=2 Tax=Leptobrachium leishanense TaxID=445787 RepID=A0A8C5QAN6_9ANUR